MQWHASKPACEFVAPAPLLVDPIVSGVHETGRRLSSTRHQPAKVSLEHDHTQPLYLTCVVEMGLLGTDMLLFPSGSPCLRL